MANIGRSGNDIQIEQDLDGFANDRFPGWYLDSTQRDGERNSERFWNGVEWTELTRPAPMLADYLGPIEPTLLAILGDVDDEPIQSSTTTGESSTEFESLRLLL